MALLTREEVDKIMSGDDYKNLSPLQKVTKLKEDLYNPSSDADSGIDTQMFMTIVSEIADIEVAANWSEIAKEVNYDYFSSFGLLVKTNKDQNVQKTFIDSGLEQLKTYMMENEVPSSDIYIKFNNIISNYDDVNGNHTHLKIEPPDVNFSTRISSFCESVAIKYENKEGENFGLDEVKIPGSEIVIKKDTYSDTMSNLIDSGALLSEDYLNVTIDNIRNGNINDERFLSTVKYISKSKNKNILQTDIFKENIKNCRLDGYISSKTYVKFLNERCTVISGTDFYTDGDLLTNEILDSFEYGYIDLDDGGVKEVSDLMFSNYSTKDVTFENLSKVCTEISNLSVSYYTDEILKPKIEDLNTNDGIKLLEIIPYKNDRLAAEKMVEVYDDMLKLKEDFTESNYISQLREKWSNGLQSDIVLDVLLSKSENEKFSSQKEDMSNFFIDILSSKKDDRPFGLTEDGEIIQWNDEESVKLTLTAFNKKLLNEEKTSLILSSLEEDVLNDMASKSGSVLDDYLETFSSKQDIDTYKKNILLLSKNLDNESLSSLILNSSQFHPAATKVFVNDEIFFNLFEDGLSVEQSNKVFNDCIDEIEEKGISPDKEANISDIKKKYLEILLTKSNGEDISLTEYVDGLRQIISQGSYVVEENGTITGDAVSSEALDFLKSEKETYLKNNKSPDNKELLNMSEGIIDGYIALGIEKEKDEEKKAEFNEYLKTYHEELKTALKNGSISISEYKEKSKNYLIKNNLFSEEDMDRELKEMMKNGEITVPQAPPMSIQYEVNGKIKNISFDSGDWYKKILQYKYSNNSSVEEIIDVINDYGWMVNKSKKETSNIPFCFVSEYEQMHNASISNLLLTMISGYYVGKNIVNNVLPAVESILDKIKNIGKIGMAILTGENVNNEEGTQIAIDANGNDTDLDTKENGVLSSIKNGFSMGVEWAKDIINPLLTYGEGPIAESSEVMNPYRFMYLLKKTGKRYSFPMMDKSASSFKSSNKLEEKEGGAGSSILGAQFFDIAHNFVHKAMGVAQDIDQIAPFFLKTENHNMKQYAIERAKFFSYPTEGEDIEITFMLYNTIEKDIWKKHYNFIIGFLLRNLPYKQDIVSYYPPLFYDVIVPGVKRCPYCYVESFDVSPFGVSRILKLSSKDIGLEIESTEDVMYPVNVPEAWMVKIKFKSLIASSANQILSSMFDTPISISSK